MTHQTRITSFQQLIKYFDQEEITTAEIIQICAKSKLVWFTHDHHTKQETITLLVKHWDKYKNADEKPLFLD